MGHREIKLDDRQFTLISKAVADPKRFGMLQRIGALKEAPTCSCICDWTGLAPATVSHHLKELDYAGLVNVERAPRKESVRRLQSGLPPRAPV